MADLPPLAAQAPAGGGRGGGEDTATRTLRNRIGIRPANAFAIPVRAR